MQLMAYSVRDMKTEIYTPPFFNKSHGEAERTFRELINDENTMPGKYPEDYDLYHLGVYDDQTGTMKVLDTPQHITKGVNVKNKKTI